jgi:lysophospholipase L1-like esterase
MPLRRVAVAVLALFAGIASAAAAQTPAALKFSFGPVAGGSGYTVVSPSAIYSDDLGYGFETGAQVVAVHRGGGDPLRDNFVTSETPFYFSVRVPEEGNYKVTVTLGDRDTESITTVKAELRRLMLERVRLAAGKFATQSFIVNVRTPRIPGGGQVRLKDREKTSEARAWDDRLTLEFSDEHPALCAVEIEKVDGIPTVFLAGDSTSTDQPVEPYNSWGQMLTRFFKPDIAVANHGESGESLRGFMGEGRLAKLLSVIRPGDYLLIQMGHNDQKEKGEGIGAFTSYKADLKKFIAEARTHDAIPVLVTSMNRLTFDAAGKITNSLGDYPEAVRQAAKEENVALIDLNAMSKVLYEAIGPVDAHLAFAGTDTTHHSDYGSYELAKCIVEGIRQSKLPLAKYLLDTPTFDPAHPDAFTKFDLPPDPLSTAQRPYGQ